ncbi:MAG: ZIP family metal transporter [Anaerovoracaceae bacterium]|jgi:ZIP family zinc transporter
MWAHTIEGILIPLLGTSLGSACVFLMKDRMSRSLQRLLSGFAAGIMTAASFWSLLVPALEMAGHMGRLRFIPSLIGFAAGIFFLLLLDVLIPHLHESSGTDEGLSSSWKRTTKLVFAVVLHNIPEGMAVGVVYAGWIYGSSNISYLGALALAIGIAIQNFPEGAIISMPLHAAGMGKFRTFLAGVGSGVVEPLGALLTLLFASAVIPMMPYLLSFAAGAMIFVVVEELIPEMSQGKHSNKATLSFAGGFLLMMVLDVALG